MADTERLTITLPMGVLAIIDELAHEGESRQSVVDRHLVPALEVASRRQRVMARQAELADLTLANKRMVSHKLRCREDRIVQAVAKALPEAGSEDLRQALLAIQSALTD
jgi:hypothetical protein